ncbi:hypothetical protein [Plebeiibacterium sediminum]|uniref:Lipoprotein n=1 Tax=Plebeiibacterium sediminum TaxID=2992112 RepID=A0AAE3M1J7_9BACT|nr:hypothetical protein [Plebeiobacterium sediminum]MCW3785105.1 hypothetical protein [Plebeiobacterium sediminum]
MWLHIKKYCIILCTLFFLTSCFKEDLSKISDNYTWEPDVSVPIFENTYYLTDSNLPVPFTSFYPNLNRDITFSKDFDLSFTNLFEDTEYIRKLSFNLGAENFFPAELHIFIDFMQNPNVYIKTLEIDPEINIPAASINNQGEITISQPFVQLIPVNIDDEDIIQNTDFIRVLIRITNREISDEIIANLENYYCDCSIGIKAELQVPIN